MKNDYLWDKKGSDAEIEKLESALQTFRFQPNSPPILPATITQTNEKQRFSLFPNFFRFAKVAMASLAICITAFLIWLNFSNTKINDVSDMSKPLVEPILVEIPKDSPVENQENFVIRETKSFESKKVSVSKPIQIKSIEVKKPIQLVSRKKSFVATQTKESKEVTISQEEQYAYDQLMLALSITSSKLKEVKDKANSQEEKTADINSLK